MNLRVRHGWLLCLLACGAPQGGVLGSGLGSARLEESRALLGTTVRIVTWAEPERQALARQALDAAFERIDGLQRALSDYEPGSELSQFCARASAQPGTWFDISTDLGQVLARALELAHGTGGAFDPSVAPLSHLMRRAMRQEELPSSDEWQAAKTRVGWERLELLPPVGGQSWRARSLHSGLGLDLGGIGKGWIADRALEVLCARGFARSLVACGGDIVAGDAPPGARGWRVAALGFAGASQDSAPAQVLEISRAALSTSGDAFQYLELDGRRLAHIVDPRSASLLEGPRAAGCLARDGATADALATALCVVGRSGLTELAARFGECSFWVASPGPAGEERAAVGAFGHNGARYEPSPSR